MHARLHQTIRRRSLLTLHQRLLVAVSGGQDSLCLLRLMLDLQPKWGWTVAVVHCNHGWRPDASANAAHVRAIAVAESVPYHEAVAPEDLAQTEAAARDWRYRQFEQIAVDCRYDAVLTGHTASDRAETLLYNLVRGSGADGLQALSWRRLLGHQVELVRPLLDFTRSDTARICHERHLPIWEDSTNSDLRYARNRIRLELLPYLQQHLNAQAELHLAQTAELLRAEVDWLEAAAAHLSAQAQPDDGSPQINRRVLQAAPLALQRRSLRQFLLLHLSTAPSFDHIESLVTLIDAPNRTQTEPMPGGAIAHVDGDWIRLRLLHKTGELHTVQLP